VDGVIALDTTFAAAIVAAMGSVQVPRYDVVVTADNVLDTIVRFWEQPLDAPAITDRYHLGAEWLAHHKDFGGALLAAGLERLHSLPPSAYLDLLDAIRESVDGRHLLAWVFDDRTAQEDLRRASMDGGIQRTTGDYLYVVDTNVGWNKADRYVTRHIDYQVRLTPPQAHVRLDVTYKNTAPGRADCHHCSEYSDTYEGLADRCYWNYLRILVPDGARLHRAEGIDGQIDTAPESAGTVSWGMLVVVPQGEERRLTLEYTLSAESTARFIDVGEYDLLVQKQPGTMGATFSLEVLAPTGMPAPITLRDTSTNAKAPVDLDHDLIYSAYW
jgi:hypothetical protein